MTGGGAAERPRRERARGPRLTPCRPTRAGSARASAERSSSGTRSRSRRRASSRRSSRRVLAFLIGGLVVLVTTGKNPLATYQAIFEGAGLNWFFPWVTGDDRIIAALNLQQTLLVTTPLDPHRARRRVRLPLRPVQHRRPGPVPRRRRSSRSGSARRSTGMNPFLHVVARDRRRDARGRAVGGHRRLPQGDRRRARGDHDDHAQLDRDLGRARSCSASAGRSRTTTQASVPISNDVVEGAKLPVLWGDPILQGLHDRVLRRARRARRLLGRSSTARRSATRCARSASTPRRPATAASASRATTSSRWRSPARSPASPARSTSSAGSSGSRRATSRRRTIGFVGIAVALLGRNTAVGVGLAALLFGALVNGHVDAQPRPRGLPARARRQPDADDPGPRRALRRRRRDHPLTLLRRRRRGAEAAAA